MNPAGIPPALAWQAAGDLDDPGAASRKLPASGPDLIDSCQALATDFDGTIATDGVIDPPTIDALQKFRASGRRLILVTGRELVDFTLIETPLDLFDLVVAENGGVLYNPSTTEERVLGPTPDPKFVDELRRRGVAPLSVGRVILATWEPHETVALEVIKELGVGYNLIFNKGAVMILPAAVDKAVGLQAALEELKIHAGAVVGFGDAENDHAFLKMCGLSVAVSNAIPAIKEIADVVTVADRGRGVTEFLLGLEKSS